MSFGPDYFAEYERRRAEQLSEAERRAGETGKEVFDLRRFEELLNRGSQAKREKDHRVAYYLLHPEMKTLAEYATSLLDGEPWDDTP
jgi:hypothetical protein